ncbi:peptide/nickel transport system ATP-binding protein [Microbacterium resistens]|uniref:Peptide/nickel transport system ATP-binding protein n=1 Tax=Microbacterium resistens TaxID=156977 RepID=A0ABU1SFH3_9MICO|nr:ABC transporter ATP-binding protein [Microbacterium resistens]MDR6868363.1 peptide/nickel transport system ATP-binding protein [Microbacterium resistens]
MIPASPSTGRHDDGGPAPLLTVRDLDVSYRTRGAVADIVQGVSFDVMPGEVVALVGESGSGKSTIAQTLIGMLSRNGTARAGTLEFDGQDLLNRTEREWRRLRGDRIGWVPQDPMSSLNPVIRIGAQVAEPLMIHRGLSKAAAQEAAVGLLEGAGLTDPAARSRQYQHQLSGGMRQRVLIAMATACGPQLLIADEPTSALDVTVQQHILDQLSGFVQAQGMAMLLVTHDLGVASDRADRLLVMNRGRIVEQGPTADVLNRPQDPYTRRLLAALPGSRPFRSAQVPREEGTERPAPPLLEARAIRKEFALPGSARQSMVALDEVSLTIARGRTLGVVGESGSGKSTLARIALRLEQQDRGEILFDGEDISGLKGERLRQVRRRMQVVYQNPFTSLSPRMTVREIVEEPLRAFGVGSRAERRSRAEGMIDRVALPSGVLTRRPRELSGGQRQRVAIARALILEPDLLVCDEPTSALDVSVQSQILLLLDELQGALGLGIMFISHDLAVVKDIAHDVMVLRRGVMVESGAVERVFLRPEEDYTRELLAAAPGTIAIREESGQPDTERSEGTRP